MKVYTVACCMLLAACASKPPPLPPAPSEPPPVVVPFQPEPAPVAAKPASTEKVAKSYQRAAQKEIPAVIAPDATPERVRSVHAADVAARRALAHLEAQGHHPTQAALDAARAAVKRLSDVLSSSDGE